MKNELLISMRRGFASAWRGTTTVSTPFSNSAVMRTASTCSGVGSFARSGRAHYRDRWAALHMLRLIAAMTALALLLLALSTRSAF